MPAAQQNASISDAHTYTAPEGQGPIRLCIIVTIGRTIQVLYSGRLEFLQANGCRVTIVCASSALDEAIRSRGVRLFTLPLTRAISPWQDFRALWKLFFLLRRERFDIVEVSTPKAALLGSIAARMARVPCLIHILRGLAYEGQRGLTRVVLRLSTRIPCRLADVTFAVSRSVLDGALCGSLCDRKRLRLVGMGSANGVDLHRFCGCSGGQRAAVRAKYGIGGDSIVLTFIGRMTRDKGLIELAEAFRLLRRQIPQLVLVLVGEYEQRDRPPSDIVAFLSADPRVRHVGWQEDVVPFLSASDIFVLPTHREGLGNVLLEAAAMRLPTVTTNATGARDAGVHGVTGFQVPVGDVHALCGAILRLAQDRDLRQRMGSAGRRWVEEHFDRERVWRRYAAEYRKVFAGCRHSRFKG